MLCSSHTSISIKLYSIIWNSWRQSSNWPSNGWAPQASGHGPKLPEFKKCLDNAFRHKVWILGGACVEPGVGLDFCGPPPTRDIWCDSMSFYKQQFKWAEPSHAWELLHVPAELMATCSILCTTASSCSCSLNKTSSWNLAFILHQGSFQLGQFHVGNEIWKGKVRIAMFSFCMQQMSALRKSVAETTALEMTEKCPCRWQVPAYWCCYL